MIGPRCGHGRLHGSGPFRRHEQAGRSWRVQDADVARGRAYVSLHARRKLPDARRRRQLLQRRRSEESGTGSRNSSAPIDVRRKAGAGRFPEVAVWNRSRRKLTGSLDTILTLVTSSADTPVLFSRTHHAGPTLAAAAPAHARRLRGRRPGFGRRPRMARLAAAGPGRGARRATEAGGARSGGRPRGSGHAAIDRGPPEPDQCGAGRHRAIPRRGLQDLARAGCRSRVA